MGFKKLVTIHFTKQRSVKFYAYLLFISPKHLSETIKSETSKLASEWIGETVVLETKILLQESALSIA
jgi:AraC family transcriptional regulator, transcriptional activator of pobA